MPPAEFPRAQAIERRLLCSCPFMGREPCASSPQFQFLAGSQWSPGGAVARRFRFVATALSASGTASSRTSRVPIGGSSLCVSFKTASRRSWQSNPRREWKSVPSAARGMSGTPVILRKAMRDHRCDVATETRGNGRPGGGHARYFLARLSCRKLLGGPSGIGFKRLNKLRVEQ